MYISPFTWAKLMVRAFLRLKVIAVGTIQIYTWEFQFSLLSHVFLPTLMGYTFRPFSLLTYSALTHSYAYVFNFGAQSFPIAFLMSLAIIHHYSGLYLVIEARIYQVI